MGSANSGVSDWTQFQGSASHSGFSSSPGPTSDAEVWESTIGGSNDGIIASGNIVIVSRPDAVGFEGLSVSNGDSLYNYTTKPPNYCPDYNGAMGSTYPAVQGDLIFYEVYQEPGGNCGLFLSPDQWSPALGIDYLNNQPGYYIPIVPANVESPAYSWGLVAAANGNIYFAGFGNNVLASFLPSSQSELWNVTLSGDVGTVPTVGGSEILIGFTNNKTVEAVSTSGLPLWNFSLDAPPSDTPSYSDGDFFVGTANGTLYALDSSGQIAWKDELVANIQATPAAANGYLYVGTDNGTLYGINAADGTIDWDSDLGGLVQASPVVASNGVVYAGTTMGDLFALNATSGAQIWAVNIGAAVSEGLVLQDGYLLVMDASGVLHAFGTPVSSQGSGTSTIAESGTIQSATSPLGGTITQTSTRSVTSTVTAQTIVTLNPPPTVAQGALASTTSSAAKAAGGFVSNLFNFNSTASDAEWSFIAVVILLIFGVHEWRKGR